jgi:DNA primase catalytic subunit
MKDQEKERIFTEYYCSERFMSEVQIPIKSSMHHFRFEYFSDNRTFKRIYDVIDNKTKLKKIVEKRCPKNVYFTPVKWLDPVNVRRTKVEEIKDYMLSSPLFFDVDMQLLSPPTLSSAQQMTENLIEYIEEKSGIMPDWIVFSGRRGFHVYYWSWDNIAGKYFKADERIAIFKRNRQEILEDLSIKGIIVDNSVTSDPWRVLRVPGTLHGESGLIAKVLRNLKDFSIKATEPKSLNPNQIDK